MEKYTVSLVWVEHKPNGVTNISNSLMTNIDAFSENDAFGIAYDANKNLHKNHNLFSKVVGVQSPSKEDTNAR